MKEKIFWSIAAVVIVIVAAAYLLPVLELMEVRLPKYQPPPGDVLELEQNWRKDQRHKFHYTRQGTRMLPAKWFMALEQPCFSPFHCGHFADQEYLGRFGFLAGPKDPQLNPLGQIGRAHV